MSTVAGWTREWPTEEGWYWVLGAYPPAIPGRITARGNLRLDGIVWAENTAWQFRPFQEQTPAPPEKPQ